MDALPGVGHACGHNLIGMAGVAIACALKAAMEKHNISGKIVLLGTPGIVFLRFISRSNIHVFVKLRKGVLAK